jgi:hypothetical protein
MRGGGQGGGGQTNECSRHGEVAQLARFHEMKEGIILPSNSFPNAQVLSVGRNGDAEIGFEAKSQRRQGHSQSKSEKMEK